MDIRVDNYNAALSHKLMQALIFPLTKADFNLDKDFTSLSIKTAQNTDMLSVMCFEVFGAIFDQ